MHALIVADLTELGQKLTTAAREVGFEAALVTDRLAATQAFIAHRPEVVIATWRLSELDGLNLLGALRQLDPERQSIVLIVTNSSAPADLHTILEAGADDYFLYPIEPELLRFRLSIAARHAQFRANSVGLEQQLRESIERFELAVRGANDGLWDAQPLGQPWHRPTTSVWYSARLKELLGYRDDELPNVLESWESRLHPEDRERVFQALNQHIEHKQPYDVEYRLRIRSGEYRWFSARGQAIWDQQGRLMRMAGSLRDITQSKMYEAKVEQSEARWRSLVENAPDIIVLADLDGTIRFINRDTPIARESIGRKTYEYIDEPFKEPMRQAFEAVRTTGKPQRYEVHGQTEHGVGMLWYANRVGPIWHNGRVESCVLIGTDITDRKIAEEQLHRERQLLRRLLDLQERDRQLVAYDIHDGLVQYLTGGLMHLEASAASGGAMPPKSQAEYDRGLGLLRDALSEARRLISGLRPPILDEQGIAAALEYLINESRPDIPQLVFINRTHFGRLAAPLEVAIFRITQEALANIRQHSGAKRARVELLQHGDWVRLVIRDWGCGFDTTQVHEERFGLQGVRQRARLLGTIATIESIPGQGTVIAVDFPLVYDDQTHDPPNTLP